VADAFENTKPIIMMMNDGKYRRSMHMTVYKILVCNDDTSLLKMIEWSLKDRGYAVMTVTRVQDAIAALHRNHFDVVLTDMEESSMTAHSVLKEAKRVDPESIVILLGCRSEQSYHPESYAAAADEYVLMPCGAAKIWKTVSSCLERMELRRRDARCRESRRHLLSLAGELKRLRNGESGVIDDVATAALTEALQTIDAMIRHGDDELSASNALYGDNRSSSHHSQLNARETERTCR
jgi:DNA-binding NtrC family response regulator